MDYSTSLRFHWKSDGANNMPLKVTWDPVTMQFFVRELW